MSKYLFSLFLLCPLLLNAGANADLKLGNKAYAQDKYGAAYEYYQKAANAGAEQGVYNSGAALYRLKDYEGASRQYLQAAKDYENKNDQLVQDSYYNAANAQYMDNKTEEALSSARKAIMLNSKDEAAIHNMQFMIEQCKNGSQDQKNKDGKQNSPQDNQDNSQDQNQSGNNEQDKQNQDQQEQEDKQQEQEDKDKLSQQQAQDILKMLGEGEKKNSPPPLQGNAGKNKNNETQVEKDW
jgi:AAA ATPase containing von Willebrand factor type A (vWA) domain